MPSIVGIFWHCQMNYCCAAEKRSNSLLENLLESPTDLRNDKNPRIPIKTRNTGVLKLFVFHRYNHFNFHLRSHRQILYSKTGSGRFLQDLCSQILLGDSLLYLFVCLALISVAAVEASRITICGFGSHLSIPI